MALSTDNAYAQDISGVAKLFGWDLSSLISESLANFFYTLQTIASWLIVITGSLLNFSINLTMHIKDFVDATPAIYTVWKAIRDISGIFIIFSLLYAAIMLITGVRSPGFSGLIKNIVIAGVLINFSFFITGLAIDASNIVSLQLYNAIAPSQDNTLFSQKNPLNKLLEASTGRVGLANVFMQSLGITRLYNPDGGLSTAGKAAAGSLSAPLKIIVIGVTSIIIMITAALSFFLASIAFVVRFVILLFLLAFSPIVFASFVIPSSDLGTYAKKWTGLLKSQLIFMPVYLLLMYFALSVLTQSSIFKNGYAGPLVAGGAWYSDLLAIAVNAVLVIIMMNVPLIAAMAIGGKMPKWAESVTAGAVWKKVGGWTKQGGVNVWRDTGGMVASRIAQGQNLQRRAGQNILSEVALRGARSVAANYNSRLTQRTQEHEQFAQTLNRQGAAAYADRIASSIPAVTGQSMAHFVGRADRVGAARILTTRLNEVRTDANRLTSELNQINNAANQINPATGAAFGIAGLPQYQQDRYSFLTGTVSAANPGGINEITDAQNDLNNIQAQINQFQTNTGATVRDTTRRNY